MKFLIKIEEAVDQLILTAMEKMKHVTPSFIFSSIDWIKHIPSMAKTQVQTYAPKLRVIGLKFIGYAQHYVTIVKGQFVGALIYLKSEEFKKKDKVEMVLVPLRKFKTDPVKAFSVLMMVCFFASTTYFIYMNTQKIIVGTKALRAPASVEAEEEDPTIELTKLKYHIHDKELFLDVTIVAKSIKDRDDLAEEEEKIKEELLELHLSAAQLPLTSEDMAAIKIQIMGKLDKEKVQMVEVKQALEGRPKYFLQTEKLTTIKDVGLQLFLEDTKRNRQIWVDFTAVTSNRNTTLFLKDHEVEVRDYINMHVEPVIPQLPIEEEGRQIIKDKLKLELNHFLKDQNLEGKVLDVYLDYLMVS